METASSKPPSAVLICPRCGSKYDADSGAVQCAKDEVHLIGALDDPLVGSIVASRYEILELTGVGAASRVYKARQTSLNRLVAIKVLQMHLALDAKKLKRFELEAKNASSIEHANIVNVFDYGTVPQPYIVMEFLQGETLAERIKKGHVPAEEAIEIICQVCDALMAAHEGGLVHRDLKPANVMLASNQGSEYTVKVLDFGLAKAVDGEGQTLVHLTSTGQMLGSPAYMSPEQCMGGAVDARSDIYSLGCLIYEVLTGRIAFESDTAPECMRKHVYEMPAPMTGLAIEPQLLKQLEKVVFKALAKEPVERYQSVADLKFDLVSSARGGTKRLNYSKIGMQALVSQCRRLLRNRRVRAAIFASALSVVAFLILCLNLGSIINAGWQAQYEQGKTHAASADYKKAESSFESALKLAKWFGQSDWRVTRSLSQLKNVYEKEGNAAAARDIGSRIKALEESNPNWTTRRMEAQKAEKAGDFRRAEQLLTGLIAQEQSQPQGRFGLSSALLELGHVYEDEGKLAEAESVIRQCLEIREKFLDEGAPLVTDSLNELANACSLLGRYSDAQNLFLNVLALKRQQLGSSNQEVAQVLGKLGSMRMWQGDFAGAQRYLQDAMSILNSLSQKDDSIVGPITGTLANLYVRTKRYDQAEPLILQSIDAQQKAYGKGNLQTCPGLTILANLRSAQGRVDEATSYMKDVLDINLKQLGEYNSRTLTALDNYAQVLRSKDPAEADKIKARADQVRQRLAQAGAGK
jgi:serine/threonine protein kinase